jgi:hypothetical protein
VCCAYVTNTTKVLQGLKSVLRTGRMDSHSIYYGIVISQFNCKKCWNILVGLIVTSVYIAHVFPSNNSVVCDNVVLLLRRSHLTRNQNTVDGIL